MCEKQACVFLEGEEPDKPTQKTLSKAKLDTVIELNRKYFSASSNSVVRDVIRESLREAEKDCGEEIHGTGLLDIIRAIILRHNTSNETIYKVYEVLGYKLVD